MGNMNNKIKNGKDESFKLVGEMYVHEDQYPFDKDKGVQGVIRQIIRQVLDEGWCRSFIFCGSHIDPEIVKLAIDENFTLFLCMPGSRNARKSSQWFKNDPQASEKLAMNEIQKLEVLHKARPGNAFWEIFIEEDTAGFGYSQKILSKPPLTHTEAAERFLNHLKKVINETRNYGTMPRVGFFGFASSSHYAAQAGCDMIWIERINEQVEDHQTANSFARGASKQYGVKWGIDFALYWSPVRGNIYKETSFYTRHYYLAYFAGADMFRMERFRYLFTEDCKELNEVGKVVKDFSFFTQRYPDRGTPDVPVAFLLPVDHGWLTPPYWRTENTVWNFARIPYRPGDFQMDGLFSLAFPGSNFYQDSWPFGAYVGGNPKFSFSLSRVPADRVPEGGKTYEAPQPLPFGRFSNRDDVREAVEKGFDVRPYRPMGDTRWGDIIDVLLADAPGEVLKQYPLLVLCGPICVEGGLKQRLMDYVKAGGTLVVAGGQVGPGDADLVGAEIEPVQRVGRAWVWDSKSVVEPFRYLPSHSISANVLAKTNSGDPLVYENQLGQGTVYTCTVPYMGNGVSPLAGVGKQLMDEVVAKVQPVTVKGLPVEWMSSRGKNFCNVVVANHDGSEWKGTIEVCKVDFSAKRLKELRFQQDIKMKQNGSSVNFDALVPAYDVRVYQIQG